MESANQSANASLSANINTAAKFVLLCAANARRLQHPLLLERQRRLHPLLLERQRRLQHPLQLYRRAILVYGAKGTGRLATSRPTGRLML